MTWAINLTTSFGLETSTIVKSDENGMSGSCITRSASHSCGLQCVTPLMLRDAHRWSTQEKYDAGAKASTSHEEKLDQVKRAVAEQDWGAHSCDSSLIFPFLLWQRSEQEWNSHKAECYKSYCASFTARSSSLTVNCLGHLHFAYV